MEFEPPKQPNDEFHEGPSEEWKAAWRYVAHLEPHEQWETVWTTTPLEVRRAQTEDWLGSDIDQVLIARSTTYEDRLRRGGNFFEKRDTFTPPLDPYYERFVLDVWSSSDQVLDHIIESFDSQRVEERREELEEYPPELLRRVFW